MHRPDAARALTEPSPRQLTLPQPRQQLRDHRFDSFVPGANTQLLEQLARGDLLRAGPVYLWGGSGTGKSHLLSAAATRVRDAGGQVWMAGGQGGAPAPDVLPLAPGQPLLIVIDEADTLDAAAQHAAFSLLARAPRQPAPVLAAGRLPPVDLPLRDDLRTRLAQGLVFEVQPLDDDGVRHVLTAEADARGLVLAPEVSHYLVTRFARDTRSLMALLDRLDAFALEQQRPLTIPLLKQMLEQRP